jgi:hypothetical protein
LKKHPSNQCARVLKALALLRLGKEDLCKSIIDKVRSEVPCEDSTLQAMSMCYREIQQRKLLAPFRHYNYPYPLIPSPPLQALHAKH